MDLLILLTYGAFAIGAFKLFRIPVNGYTIVTAVLGGVGLLAAIVATMNYNHPYSRIGRFYYHTTPIVPNVKGTVIEVAVHDAQEVKAGDVLFKIDPTSYQAIVDQKQALLAAAERRFEQAKANLTGIEEAVHAAEADRDAAKDIYDRDTKLRQSNTVSEQAYEQARQAYLGSVALVSRAQAQLADAKLEVDATINGFTPEVAEAKAALAAAQFDLDSTIVRAPTDGRVLQVFVRPGMMATPLPLRPVLIFRHAEPRLFVASFLQNSAQRIKVGDEAEVAFPAAPGYIFPGKVVMIGTAIAQGQLQPTGTVMDAEQIVGEGRLNVTIEFEESEFDGFEIADGFTGETAVYSDHMEGMAVMRRVLLRMKSWTNFVFSDGHEMPPGEH
ncbi:HlyD family secretion protein [Blastopirellula sp. JC732]|uniref:HlyD family secretion protein n=1 Tax=Blastopirellula sediminis TaxID=2894196 RepID=A0A9X1MRU9_9BACT|nr:HlyD family secretion protein [Blastopirellula sediminis]MCC9605378.1 HlyD family secretion protein [Blastopirellula sediminis]MCC9631322.1 HlyD family secretion protein [Blastopirellula sediminis]